ncbi:2-hydroxychromene-2-carboxylate isomerase [Ruegeria sp. THAF57]|uniref:2-hydroxychromene-2-carboxylate isomerase n=1 Tax=Ruegeria sp. THAF57 TaxID=2744555 RepID=UPI0015DDD6DF|nr:2-hydroxychromene-2-carboxylate isomerase [Ruegeria sp. THAF57]CAD0187241.1 2-hydroxychromene-2-carboxylate isomerase [Ruegeria sp. THAF57]
MSVTVDFIYDFGSPNAYFCHKVVPQIEQRTGVKFNYIPCLLGGIFKATNNMAPAFAFSKIKGKLDYDRIEINRFVQKYDLTDYVFNKHFPVNTLLLMRGAAAAELDGIHDAYIQAGFSAMWEKSLKMDDPEVFAQAMTDAGLDGQRLLARTQDQDVKDRLVANTSAAVDRKVFGIPTVFVGSEIFFGKERLGQIEEEIVRQQAGAAQ